MKKLDMMMFRIKNYVLRKLGLVQKFHIQADLIILANMLEKGEIKRAQDYIELSERVYCNWF